MRKIKFNFFYLIIIIIYLFINILPLNAADNDSVLVIFATSGGSGISDYYIQNQTDSIQTAGFNLSGNAMIGGSIGLGTLTPEGIIHIKREAVGTTQPQIILDTGIPQLSRISRFTSDNPRIDLAVNTYYDGSFNLDDTTTYGGMITIMPGINPTSPLFRLRYFEPGENPRTYKDAIFVNCTGRVGIGTTNPKVSLHIDGTDAIKIPVGDTSERPDSPSDGMIRYNNETGILEVYANGSWRTLKNFFTATGGDEVYEFEGYKIHKFISVGTHTFSIGSVPGTIEVLVVAGGGAGGSHVTHVGTSTGGGGGGAGGVLYNENYTVSSNEEITVIVGSGGISPPDVGQGGDGGNSRFGTMEAIGGGGGGYRLAGGRNGGSGGGGGYQGICGTGISGQGNNGASTPGTNLGGSGGGGANSEGISSVGDNGGSGGSGVNYSTLFGTDVGVNGYFAGGGGGGAADSYTPGSGGIGGGGTGGSNSNGSNGVVNTGGGGGGSGDYGNRGGNGGSGIILIRYPI